MADETAKPAGSSGQESRPERWLKSLSDMKEFVLNLSDEEWKALDENAPNRCSRAEFAAYCTKMEAHVSTPVTPKHFPALTGTLGKEAVLPVEGEIRRSEAEAGAPFTSSQRAPEGNGAICSMFTGMVKRIQMPVQEAIQRVASYQMWMPLKGKTELRQEADAEVSSVPRDLRLSPAVAARSARLTTLRRLKDRLAPLLCCFSQTSSLQSGLKSSWDLSVSTPLRLTHPHSPDMRDHKKTALRDRHHWPERRPKDQVSLCSCTVEIIETVMHLYKAEIKDTPESQQVQKLMSDSFQALCTHVVWDLLRTRLELFLVETPTPITKAWASHSVLPMKKLSAEGSMHLSEAAGDISKSLLEYLITPDAAVSSILSEAVTSGETRFYSPLELSRTVESYIRDFVGKLNKFEIASSTERNRDQVGEIRIGEEDHGDGRNQSGNVTGPYFTPKWSKTALELAWERNSLLEDPFDLDRTHSEGSLDKMFRAWMPYILPRFRVGSGDKKADSDPSMESQCAFNHTATHFMESVTPSHPGSGLVEDAGLGTSDNLPTSPSRADNALVLDTSNEESHHCSTSPAKDSCSTRPVPAAPERRKLPTFRFGKKLNKVHPLEKIGEEHQSTSSGNPQEASNGESEASASSFKKLRKHLSRIFRAMTKA